MQRSLPHLLRTGSCGAVALALLVFAAVETSAQPSSRSPSTGGRWTAWIGCWSPSAPTGATRPDSASPVVCIVPTAHPSTVSVTTFSGGGRTATTTLDAGGAEEPVTERGCTGTQRGMWSADERRVYLISQASCDGVTTSQSALLGMTRSGEWLDVRAIQAGGGSAVRVARYRAVPVPAGADSTITGAVADRGFTTTSSRLASGADVGPSAVIEASRTVDAAVVEAWLLERRQSFHADADMLRQLADAGVPGTVTDAVVAVSYPRRFGLARGERHASETAARIPVTGGPIHDPWGYGGYGRYGWYGPYGGYYPPYVVAPGRSAEPDEGGTAVNGRGYTRGAGASESAGTAHRPRAAAAEREGSAGSSGSGNRDEGGSRRTARPRP